MKILNDEKYTTGNLQCEKQKMRDLGSLGPLEYFWFQSFGAQFSPVIVLGRRSYFFGIQNKLTKNFWNNGKF